MNFIDVRFILFESLDTDDNVQNISFSIMTQFILMSALHFENTFDEFNVWEDTNEEVWQW